MINRPPARQDPARPVAGLGLDPATQSPLETPEQRPAKPGRARPKATYDLPETIIKAVQQVAARENVAQSDVVAWALGEFLERYDNREERLEAHKRPTRSLRAVYKLVLPPKWR